MAKLNPDLNPDCEMLYSTCYCKGEHKCNPTHDCFSLYDCCDCGGHECGCGYCFSCNACESCFDFEF